jgi:flagellar motor switch protein FliN
MMPQAQAPFADMLGGEFGEAEDLDSAMAALQGAMSAEDNQFAPPPPPLPLGAAAARSGNVIMNIPVEVQIVLGSTEMSVSELMALGKGSTVALDRRIGEPVDVMVNGRHVARGEITVLDHDPSRFGIRLTEIVSAQPSA